MPRRTREAIRLRSAHNGRRAAHVPPRMRPTRGIDPMRVAFVPQVIAAMLAVGLARADAPKGGVPFPANDSSSSPSLSADGRWLAFSSAASNLVPGDTNGSLDVFVLDRQNDVVTRAGTNADGGQPDGPGFSPLIAA